MIDSLKSTAVILGFLFSLSIAYYISFWSNFHVDVFQHIAIEDIIKGIAYPLRYAGFLLIFFVGYMLIAVATTEYYAKGQSAPSKFQFWVLFITSLLLSVFFVLVYFKKQEGNIFYIGLMLSLAASALFFDIYKTADGIYNRKKQAATIQGIAFDEKHPALKFMDDIIIASAVFLFISALVTGQADARNILEGKRFDYIMLKNLPKDKIHTNQPYLVLLGAISEKYILIDCSHTERFYVDKDDMHTVQTYYYNYRDSLSVNRLRREMFR
jgi:hypothetical protein